MATDLTVAGRAVRQIESSMDGASTLGRNTGETLRAITVPGKAKTLDAARNRIAALSRLTFLQSNRMHRLNLAAKEFQKQLDTYARDMTAARDEEKQLKSDLAKSMTAFQDRSKLKQVDGQWWTDGTNRFKEPGALQAALGENSKRQQAIVEAFTKGQFALQQWALGTVSTVDPRNVDRTMRVDTMVNKVLAQRFQYAWGGGGPDGPSHGVGDNGGAADANKDWEILGFDCSGLTAFLNRQTDGSTIGVTSEIQYAQGKPTTDPQLGDLVFPAGSFGPEGPKHVMYYLGNGMAIEAPSSGKPLRVVEVEPDAQFRTPQPTDPDSWNVRKHNFDPRMGPTPTDMLGNPLGIGKYGQGSPYTQPAPVE